MKKYLVDASVLIALINQKDAFHGRAFSFFQKIHTENNERISSTLVIGMHTLFEVNNKIRKLKRKGSFIQARAFSAFGQENYPLDLNFVKKAEQIGAYDKFEDLGSQDMIYATIALIENIPLVTFDKDYRKVKTLIEVIEP